MSPRLASEVRFVRELRNAGHGGYYVPVLTIDGEPFPYYLVDKPRVELDPETGLSTVFVAILADRVVVDLSLSDEANAAVDASLARFPEAAS